MITQKKILLVFGTRPEAIKMAPLINCLKADSNIFDVKVCVTGQHREMLSQVIKIFDIVPDIDLDIMTPGQDLFDISANILIAMKKVLLDLRPNIVLVHGDTTTTLAVSMACFYSRVNIGHIEAGLRTHDIYTPYPEEFNRQVTSKIATWHFCPTELNRANLILEGVDPQYISVTGNTVIDALHDVVNRLNKNEEKLKEIKDFFLERLKFDCFEKRFILITGHRRENFGIKFFEIFDALREVAILFPFVHFIYPVHLNPNVQTAAHASLGNISNIHLIEPLEYDYFVYLLSRCYFVITDSGGIQEEAPSLGKPVLVIRDVTERNEAVEAGIVELVGANKDRIVAGVSRLLNDEKHYLTMSCSPSPYGNGSASQLIANVLREINF